MPSLEAPGMKRSILVLLSALFLALPTVAQPALSVTGNAYQGSALFVRLSASDSQETPRVTWNGETYDMVQTSAGDWETVVPVEIDAKPQLTLTVEQGETTLTRSVSVKKRGYGYQELWISADTLANYDTPQNKADDQAIIDALKADREPKLFEGDFRAPITAPESTNFGMKRLYNGWRKGWHKGLDLAGWAGQAVKSPADGVVILSTRGVVNGNTLVLSHGAGVGSVYLHLSSIQVTEGQKVKAGQVIGKVGGTGGFAPHLHWETRVHGEPVYPKLFYAVPQGW